MQDRPVDWQDDGHCFACGPRNPIGLHLRFEETDTGMKTRFVPDCCYQGYQGVVHGGVVATLLDEVAIQLLWAKGYTSVTARLEVRFLKPVPVGKEVVAEATLLARTGRAYRVNAVVKDADGDTLATATATCLKVKATAGAARETPGRRDAPNGVPPPGRTSRPSEH
jgi:uncharacterized protein (TIGR00369 family)